MKESYESTRRIDMDREVASMSRNRLSEICQNNAFFAKIIPASYGYDVGQGLGSGER